MLMMMMVVMVMISNDAANSSELKMRTGRTNEEHMIL